MISKIIFIIGLPRSGSTLWNNIISQNSEILCMPEIHFLHPFRKDFRNFFKNNIGNLDDNSNIMKMIDLILSDRIIKGIDGPFWKNQFVKKLDGKEFRIELFNRIASTDKSLRSIFNCIIEVIMSKYGFTQCCVKFPVYPNFIPLLIDWYPNCKIIHITRDPRAIAISKTNDPRGANELNKKYPILKPLIRKIMILYVIVQYIWTSFLYQKYKGFKSYRLFRYEDLLYDPVKTVKDLCKFIDIPYHSSMIDLEKSNRLSQPSSITGVRINKIDIRGAYRWKKIASPFEKLLINSLTRESMSRLDYNPEKHKVFIKRKSV